MNLTWRDMQHLVVRTSHPAHLSTDDWRTNGVGRRVSHSYGYGLLDAGAMVALAQNWTSVGPQHQCVLTMLSEPRDISSRLLFSKTLDACWGKPEYVSSLEHVQACLTLSYNHRGNLAIHLISPLGTRSTLLAPSQFTLILYGTGSSSINPSSPDFPRPSNNSCKTFDAQQICIECSPGFSLFLQGCVKLCPPGFTSGPQLLNLSLDNWVDLSSIQACLPCHPACLTCSSPGPNDCLSCPPHSHLVLTACLHQNQVQRKSPTGPVLQGEGSAPGESPVGSEQGGEEESPGPSLGLSSPLVTLLAVLSCAFILAAFAGVFLLLQLRSGGAPWARRTKLHSVETGGGASGGIRVGFGFGLGLGWERQGRVSYKGIPTVWGDEDQVTLGGSESDSEELDCHSERTAFIRTQSSL
ncbi:unnamed protein product, partial [Coregonus sp. 'balchen']